MLVCVCVCVMLPNTPAAWRAVRWWWEVSSPVLWQRPSQGSLNAQRPDRERQRQTHGETPTFSHTDLFCLNRDKNTDGVTQTEKVFKAVRCENIWSSTADSIKPKPDNPQKSQRSNQAHKMRLVMKFPDTCYLLEQITSTISLQLLQPFHSCLSPKASCVWVKLKTRAESLHQ